MKIDNDAVVTADPQQVFALINDVDRVASCLPGAELLGPEGEDGYRGRVGLRVGPIGASFEGVLRFVEVDEAARTMHLVGRGSDIKGNGDAEADVRLAVLEHPDGALLQITTDVNIRGKFAQFGKGAIGTVSDKILGQFARNLAALLEQGEAADGSVATGDSAAVATGSRVSAAGGRRAPSQAAGSDPTRRVVVLAAVFAAGCVEGWILTRAFGRKREMAA